MDQDWPVVMIPVDKIIPDPRNENKHTEDEVHKTAQFLKQTQLPSILIRSIKGTNMYKIVHGELRWRAHMLLGNRTIRARICDVDEKTAAQIRYQENRNILPFTAECRSCANLYQLGYSPKDIASSFGQESRTILVKIAVGNFPNDLLEAIQGEHWGLRKLGDLLAIRLNEQGKLDVPGEGWLSYPNAINYSEVWTAVQLVNSGKLATSNELRNYIRKRREEIECSQLVTNQPKSNQRQSQKLTSSRHSDIQELQFAQDLKDLQEFYEERLRKAAGANEVRIDKTINTLKQHAGQIANLLVLLTMEQANLLSYPQFQELFLELKLLQEKVNAALHFLQVQFAHETIYPDGQDRRLEDGQ